MKVLKFGGTSVGTAESLANVKAIVGQCRGEQVIVVVSALGGLTDKLIATANLAASGNPAWEDEHTAMVGRHNDIIDAVIPAERREEVKAETGRRLQELADEYRGIARAGIVGPAALNRVVATGERCSSVIVTAMLPDARRFDSLEFIKTISRGNRNILDNDASAPLIEGAFSGWDGPVAVVPGFISTDSATGAITNLGRGGSDYTAAILAAALNARLLEIWTDVDGFLTADPRVIPSARVVDEMTFVEAMDLCTFGAKVIYPPTIYPVFHKNIPIYIKNTFNPDAPGTRVADNSGRASATGGFKGVASLSDTFMITVRGSHPENVASLESRLLNGPARRGLDVVPVTDLTGDAPHQAIAVRDAGGAEAVATLREEFNEEFNSGDLDGISFSKRLATIAVVGRDVMRFGALRDYLANILADAGITMAGTSSKTSETSFILLVDRNRLKDALLAIHDALLDHPFPTSPSPYPSTHIENE